MPTDTIKKIGATNSPVTMDYTTLQSWEDACPANLVTSNIRYIGECYDQGEFVVNGTVLTISGQTVDATRYIILRCATGASFKDKSGVRTTALYYNASNGVAIRSSNNYGNAILCNTPYTQFDGLQISAVNEYCFSLNTDYCVVTNCIIYCNGRSPIVSAGAEYIYNCLCIMNTFSGGPVIDLQRTGGTASVVIGCTAIRLTSQAGYSFSFDNYAEVTVIDCCGFGSTTGFVAGGQDANASHHNATDLGTGFGTNNVTNLVTANQFVNSTNDFRAVSTGGLHAGTPNANIPNDISGTARNATTPYIGCWEVVAAGGGSSSPTSFVGMRTPSTSIVLGI